MHFACRWRFSNILFSKKLIAQVMYKTIEIIRLNTAKFSAKMKDHLLFPSSLCWDHFTFSLMQWKIFFPFTTPSSQVSNLFAQNLSLTLHSTLDLYKHLFGRRKMLPRKPRFHRMATLIACLFGGWLTVRDDVLGIFGVCKDTEFLAMRQLLDELLPLVLYYYSTIHRGCRYSLWQNATLHLAIMFIVQQRHNYNKAMLGVISDNIYREAVIPEWKTTFSSYMNVFSEKKVETFHSLLRMQCPSWSSAEQIIEFAQVISANGFDHEFSSNFLTNPPKKTNKQSVTILAGKSAEYLVTKFEELYNQPNQSHEVLPTGRRKNRRTFYLKTMNCSVDQRSLPLFSAGEIPSQDFLCDFKDCTQDDDTVVLLSCGHSFHDACLHENGCRYCQPYILDCIKRLAKAFNKSIFAEADEEEEQPGGEQDNDEEEDAAEEQAEWYTTQLNLDRICLRD